MASAGYDNWLILWDVRTNKQIYKITAHSDPVTSIDISNDDKIIMTTSYDGFCRFWDSIKN